MKQPHKPKGYSTVSPYIVADGAQAVIDFLIEVFGGTVPRRFDNPDGSVMHAEIKIEDTVIMMGDSGGEFPAFPVWLHVYVADVDATYEKALAAGGTAVEAPKRREGDSDRRGGVKDPAGNTWWIATQLADE